MTYKDIRNIGVVPQPHRDRIKSLVHQADMVFAHNRMEGGMIHSFFYDSVSGQIIRSLRPREAKKRYYNKLSDFYIDSRVGFKGRRELQDIIEELEYIFMQTTKFKKQQFHIGDWVRIPKGTDYPVLRDHRGKKAKIVKLSERSISNPDYEGFYVRIDNKGSYIYASSNSVKKLGKGWREKPDQTGKAPKHKNAAERAQARQANNALMGRYHIFRQRGDKICI